jgi:hypothetical protein
LKLPGLISSALLVGQLSGFKAVQHLAEFAWYGGSNKIFVMRPEGPSDYFQRLRVETAAVANARRPPFRTVAQFSRHRLIRTLTKVK